MLSSESKGFSASISPPFLPTITGDYAIEDYNNSNNVGTVRTQTQNETSSLSTGFSPLPNLSTNLQYSKKSTKDLTLPSSDPNYDKPKEVMSINSSLSIISGVSLTHAWQRERNRGEVQAGILKDLDILKESNNYSLSITLPQSSLVLTSINFSLNYKQLIYTDLALPANDFMATLLSFDGTINF